jgi:hypothetical protein
MRSVRLVFAGRATLRTWLLGHASRTGALAAFCLLAALASLAAVAWQTWEMRQQIRGVQNALASLRAQRGQSARQIPLGDRPTLTVQQSRDWNQLTRQLNTPWPAILDALEITTPETVALVAIEPDPQHGSVRLQVEAKTLDTLLGYAESLKSAEPFQEVLLLKHDTNEQDATRPVRLSLEARLKPRQPNRPDGAGVAQ